MTKRLILCHIAVTRVAITRNQRGSVVEETCRRACQSFEERGETWRLLAGNAREAICVIQDGRIRYANPKASRISGYTVEELRRIPLDVLLHPGDRVRALARIAEALSGRDPCSCDGALRVSDKSGHVKRLDVRAIAIAWHGKPALLVFAADAGGRKEAEGKSRDSRDWYDSLFFSLPAGLLQYDMNFDVLQVNDRFSADFLKGSPSMTGMNLANLHERRVIPCLAMPLEGKKGSYEGKCRLFTGRRERWVSLEALPLFLADGAPAGGLAIFRDMTDRKKSEEALKRKDRELIFMHRQLAEAKSALQGFLLHSKEALKEVERNILFNINEVILPLVKTLERRHSDVKTKACADLICRNLQTISSSFIKNVTLGHYNLTTQERHIALLVREGIKTGDIAARLGLSRRSVEHHRYRIRNKLGLCNSRTNLRTQLLGLGEEQQGHRLPASGFSTSHHQASLKKTT